MTQSPEIAIIGIGGLFPGANTLGEFKNTIINGLSHSQKVPKDRWIAPSNTFISSSIKPDKSISDRGCFIESYPYEEIEPGNFPTDTLRQLDPLFHITLIAGQRAFKDSKASIVGKKAGIILGSIALPTQTSSAFSWELAGSLIKNKLEGTPVKPHLTNSMNGFVNSLPACLLAQTLGFEGPCFTLDAACASSLYAIKLACDKLTSFETDFMLSGGVSRSDCMYTAMGFTQLGALSPNGMSAPFDKKAQGLVIGEGAGIVALKRMEDALRDGDKIYAVIKGIGLSNDITGSLMAPSSEGQLRALRKAYAQSGWSPWDVDLFECHATGTPVGDAVEFQTLLSIHSEFENKNNEKATLASTKANIGHLLTGAGAAGLIKTILCMEEKILPPMANFENPSVELENSPFLIPVASMKWEPKTGSRKAAVSAFGFGGINAHLLLEEHTASYKAIERKRITSPASVCIVGIGTHIDSAENKEEFLNLNIKAEKPQTYHGKFTEKDLKALTDLKTFKGRYADGVSIVPGKFRIPPNELSEMLPQQLLFLNAAAEAIKDSQLTDNEVLNGAIIAGINFDFATTEYFIRWNLEKYGNELSDRNNLSDEWTEQLKNKWIPALNANRVMGSLGNIVASRPAREFKFGGPSFTVSSEELSSLSALDTAISLLQRGEADCAIAGGSDINSDFRHQICRLKAGASNVLYAEGAAAIALKRTEDAIKDGNKIYAVIESCGNKNDFSQAKSLFVENASDRDVKTQLSTDLKGSLPKEIGFSGAASFAFSVCKTATMLRDKFIPKGNARPEPEFWTRNKAQGLRRALVYGQNMYGAEAVLAMSEYDPFSAQNILSDSQHILFFASDTQEELIKKVKEFTAKASIYKDSGILAYDHNKASSASSQGRYRLAVIFTEISKLIEALNEFISSPDEERHGHNGLFYTNNPLGPNARLAFVFPGSGNHYEGMGRELALRFPEVLIRQDKENEYLQEQILPSLFWDTDNTAKLNQNHPALLQGQVTMSTICADVLAEMGITPSASIGYSLGEMAGVFALRVWDGKARDEMMHNMKTTNLFTTELAGELNSVKEAWGLSNSEPAPQWLMGVVNAAPELIREKLKGRKHVYLLIINTQTDCVIGGDRNEVIRLAEDLSSVFIPIEGVITVHCEVLKPRAKQYRDFHYFPSKPVPGVDFYSTGLGDKFAVNAENIADNILLQASDTIDFPRIINKAWDDGVRIFIEAGPDNSCTRMTSTILAGRPHLAVNMTKSGRSEITTLFSACAELFATGLSFNSEKLMPKVNKQEAKTLRINFKKDLFNIAVPAKNPAVKQDSNENTYTEPASYQIQPDIAPLSSFSEGSYNNEIFKFIAESQEYISQAHQSYLAFSENASQVLVNALEGKGVTLSASMPLLSVENKVQIPTEKIFMDRAACMEFAIGSVGKVLGAEFAEIDNHPTRVRLPDEPLMLVDRIIKVEGEPLSMTKGRVVTEHDVKEGLWYLDNGRIPTCIAVEAGQADLFLSGYLGIDYITKGKAVYRLLDASVLFHDHLPQPGDVIHYDIHINNFFTQGSTWLFRFNFDATVNGRPLISMKNGCAGFFSQKELDEGRGIIHTAFDLEPKPGKLTGSFTYPVKMLKESYSDEQIKHLKKGDISACFGPEFENLKLSKPLLFPDDPKMQLTDRVLEIDPQGGKYSLGKIITESDVHPDDWFLECHFSDDHVMPGTLMYECCMHSLRIFLLRMGWIDEAAECIWEPIPGVSSSLKCRGQVIDTTKRASYEISLKEIGYNPEPYAIADALMFADGKPIVEIINMCVRLTGSSKERIEKLWENNNPVKKPALYDKKSIIEFAEGNPSQAFGERYKPFDSERKIARLPRDPFCFISRITQVNAPQWEMKPSGEIEAQYDINGDEWYFENEGCGKMPYSVLLEAALQPCGWLAAYAGSALTSKTDLYFRNLGGKAQFFSEVTDKNSFLNTRVKMTDVSSSAGMIIQHYEFDVRSETSKVYSGSTYFGFFSAQSLANQVGLRDITIPDVGKGQITEQNIPYPDTPPLPQGMIKMIDVIDFYSPDGGPYGKGFIEGSMKVRPDDWFFKAHFYQDPVIPGSLGIESLLQLMKYMIMKSEGDDINKFKCYNIMPKGNIHSWIYRGQVIPRDNTVTVKAWVKSKESGKFICDGILSVDGRNIYQINDFSIIAESR